MNFAIVPVVLDPQMSKRCIDSILAQDVPDIRVLVTVNGSPDGSLAFLSAHYWGEKRVEIIAHVEMLSLNYVWNEGIRWAFAQGAEHVFVLNNDVMLRPDMFRLLASDPGLFVTGVSISDKKLLDHMDAGNKSPHPCFSAFMIRRECWQQVGRFDEDYWAYCSDGDYHLRMDRLGIDAYAIAVPFYHETSSTIKKAPSALRDLLCKRADADRETFAQKYGFAVGSDEYYRAFREHRENKYEKEGVL